MNFLSHFYLLENKKNVDKVVGNLLPDLMRGFTKIYRQEVKPNLNIHATDLVQGIHFHLSTDYVFHNHSFFEHKCLELKEITKDYQLPMKKNYIVSHVLLELLIDRILMEKDAELAPQFYASLDETSSEEMEDKLNMTFSRQNSSNIIRIFRSFREHKYAYSLMEKNGIQKALYHIIGRRIGLSFEESNWEQAIMEGKENISKALPTFLKQLKEELNDA